MSARPHSHPETREGKSCFHILLGCRQNSFPCDHRTEPLLGHQQEATAAPRHVGFLLQRCSPGTLQRNTASRAGFYIMSHHHSGDSLSPPTYSVGQNQVTGPTLSNRGGAHRDTEVRITGDHPRVRPPHGEQREPRWSILSLVVICVSLLSAGGFAAVG